MIRMLISGIMVLGYLTVSGMQEKSSRVSDDGELAQIYAYQAEDIRQLFRDGEKLKPFIEEVLSNKGNLYKLIRFLCEEGTLEQASKIMKVLLQLEDSVKDDEEFDWEEAIRCNAILEDIMCKMTYRISPLKPDFFWERYQTGFYNR